MKVLTIFRYTVTMFLLAVSSFTGIATAQVTMSFQDGVNGYTGTRDTKLLSGTPITNYGSATTLEIDGSPAESSILYWDLASIPLGNVIQSVDITVNITNGSSHTYELYELLRPWVEGQVTWNVDAGFGELSGNWSSNNGSGSYGGGLRYTPADIPPVTFGL